MSTGALQLRVMYTNITDASIVITGNVPANAQLLFINTQASKQSRKSVFDITNIQLQTGAVVTIANTTATWLEATNAGSVVQMSTSMSTSSQSGIFVIGVTATRAASVVATADGGAYTLAERAVVAVDYCTCIDCSGALVNFGDITLGGQSMLRISNSTADVLLSAYAVTFGGQSRLLLSNSVGREKLLTVADVRAVRAGDVIDLMNVTTNTDIHLPNSSLRGTTIVAGNWIVRNTSVPAQVMQQSFANLIGVALQIVDNGGRQLDGMCSFAQCIAANIQGEASDDCHCPCKQVIHDRLGACVLYSFT